MRSRRQGRVSSPARWPRTLQEGSPSVNRRELPGESGQGQQKRTTAAFLSRRSGEHQNYGPPTPRGATARRLGALEAICRETKGPCEEEGGSLRRTYKKRYGAWGIWGRPGHAPGFRAPHRLLRAANAATTAILCRVCSLTPSLPPPHPVRVEPRILAPAFSGFQIGPAQNVGRLSHWLSAHSNCSQGGVAGERGRDCSEPGAVLLRGF